MVGERKICGVLAEASMEVDRVHHVVVGIGLNYDFPLAVLPKETRDAAMTARELVDRPLPKVPMVRTILREMDERYRRFCAGDAASVMAEWRERALTLGRKVRVETPGGLVEGKAVDIDETGRLVVRTQKGDVTVSAGDCRHLR
jgi:BirA family biotin operon repressor/biotin-[acetyl-CoA-carboxylase] ligase